MKYRFLVYSNSEICLLALEAASYLRRKESFSQLLKVRLMVEEIIIDIINSVDGDYIFQAQVLAAMKPTGW
jgi:hypothetical protein